MSKMRRLVVPLATFVAGLVFGIVGAVLILGKRTAEAVVAFQQLQLVASSRSKSFDAYRNEGTSIAIYALSQHLASLGEAEELQGKTDALISEFDLNYDRMLTHGRLAKLFDEQGEDENASRHVSAALQYAKKWNTGVTDETQLMEIVERFDESDAQLYEEDVN